MKKNIVLLFIFLNHQYILISQNDSLNTRKHFFKMTIGIGTNLIANRPFHISNTTETPYGYHQKHYDLDITSLITVNPMIGLAYSRLLHSSKKYSLYSDVESSVFLFSEKIKAKGWETLPYYRNDVEKKASNYFLGYNTCLNISLLRNLSNHKKIGLFIGGGASNTFYMKTIITGKNLTTQQPIEETGDLTTINITGNINFGFEYRYKIGCRSFCSRLFLSPQIAKTHLASFYYFAFNKKNYLTFFSTAIIL